MNHILLCISLGEFPAYAQLEIGLDTPIIILKALLPIPVEDHIQTVLHLQSRLVGLLPEIALDFIEPVFDGIQHGCVGRQEHHLHSVLGLDILQVFPIVNGTVI